MTDKTQPEALRLADAIDPFTRKSAPDHLTSKVAADELRRQHARITELEAELEAVGAGGVQALSAAPAEALGYFSFSDECDFDRHDTAEAAKAAATEMLSEIRRELGGEEWPMDVESICWGVVVERATEHDQTTGEDGEKYCDYVLKGASPTPPALSAAPAGFVPVAAFDRLHAHAESLAARLLAAEQAAPKAAPGEPVHGDVLPPVGSRVYIRHGRDNDAHACTVTGYYAWGDLGGDKRLHRVFVRLVYEGTDRQQARMLCDCYPTAEAALAQAAPQQEAQDSVSPRHPVVMQWRDNAIEACAKIADAYGHEHAAQDMRAMLTAPQPAPAPLSDDAKDAARYRWLRNKSTVLHGTAWLGSATAYQRDVDFLRRDDALAALDAAIDAAIAAQGGKV